MAVKDGGEGFAAVEEETNAILDAEAGVLAGYLQLTDDLAGQTLDGQARKGL